MSGIGACKNGGALLPIAAPSMSCEANRPLTSHSERNHSQTRARNDPAFTVPACLLTVTGRRMRRWLHESDGMRLGRCGVAVLLPVSCSWCLPLAPFTLWRSGEDIVLVSKIGCAGRDLNPRPLAYGASELPDCSTAQFFVCLLSKNGGIIAYAIGKVNGKNTPCRLWSAGRSAVAE